MVEVYWLGGAAPAFDEAVVGWLQRQGDEVFRLAPEPPPPRIVPVLTRMRRVAAYRRRIGGVRSTLVLPYLAGDALLLAGLRGWHTLGVALGSDVWRRTRTGRAERLFRRALRCLDAVWAVSTDLAEELRACGRPADWVAPVGVDVAALPEGGVAPEPGRVFSPRLEAPLYRRDWIRAAVAAEPAWNLVEADRWPQPRMFGEYARAELVVSVPVTDGAPATVMEALSCGAHVAASGGATVRGWLERFGGTYGEPADFAELARLLASASRTARLETLVIRRARAEAARQAFSRDVLLRPLKARLEDRGP